MAKTQASKKPDYIEPSLVKQKLYGRYAKGEITRQELVAAIREVRPPEVQTSWKYRLASFILLTVIGIFIPPSARQDE